MRGTIMPKTVRQMLRPALLALGLVAAAAGAATGQEAPAGSGEGAASERAQPAPAPVPATPAGVEAVLYARTFELAEPVRYAWSADVDEIRSGTILVLEADPAYLQPRALAEPVLYVGKQPAWRVSHGAASGRVVAVVPGEVALAEVPVFFGSPALPEQVDEELARAELSRARAGGVSSVGPGEARAAREAGGHTASLEGRLELLRTTQALIDRYVSR
jgi:hypothetical protein